MTRPLFLTKFTAQIEGAPVPVLIGRDDETRQWIERMDDYQEARAMRPNKRRSVPFHRRYWGILSKVASAVGIDQETLHRRTLVSLDRVEEVRSLNTGEVYLVPESTSFHNWDQEKFEQYVAEAERLWSEAFGIDPAEFMVAA